MLCKRLSCFLFLCLLTITGIVIRFQWINAPHSVKTNRPVILGLGRLRSQRMFHGVHGFSAVMSVRQALQVTKPSSSTSQSPSPSQETESPADRVTGTSDSVDCPCPTRRDLDKVKVKDVIMDIETNEDALILFFQRQNLKAEKILGRRRESLDPEFEAPLFVFPPLLHSVCLPDHSHSKVHLLMTADQLSVGSAVQFRIDLYNGCGQPRFTGGDEVRAWIKSQDGHSSVAARVKDLQNGSYVGETILPWPGLTSVRVSLTYAREFLQLSVRLYHELHSMRWTTEMMDNGQKNEKVPCLPSTPIPGYGKVCNFTARNGGRPWYCAHPVTKGLNCSHSKSFANLVYTENLDVPEPLREYVKQITNCCHNATSANFRLIDNDIAFKANKDASQLPGKLRPCSSLGTRDSWKTVAPWGWLHNGLWTPFSCTLPPLTKDRLQRCMRGRTLLLHGDSNQQKFADYVVRNTGCTKSDNSLWNAPHVCMNSTLRSSVVQISHEFPFSPGTHGNFPVRNMALTEAVNHTLQNSYPGNRLTVVLHLLMHPSTHSVQVYRALVRGARQSVQEHLKMYPKTSFVVQGPHVCFDSNHHHVHIGDKFFPWYQRIWREEFAQLWDRVWYMDTWDLTLAAENLPAHPYALIPEMMRILFGYICDDD